MDLCWDFSAYDPKGEGVSGHAVRIIGWGVLDGKNYWLIANSWGKGWGDEKDRGVFKMIRGINNCNIEKDVLGPIPNATMPLSHTQQNGSASNHAGNSASRRGVTSKWILPLLCTIMFYYYINH